MNTTELLDNIILKENAYFFQNSDSIRLSNRYIEQLFRECSEEKIGRFLVKVVNKQISLNSSVIKYSFCAFKTKAKPTFIKESLDSWAEYKTSYLLISELNEHIIVSKKNIAGIQNLINRIEPIDYKILSSLFIEEDTFFEKLSLSNMNISSQAIRHKSLKATNLQNSVSPLGSNNYIPNSFRVSNGSNKVSLALNTSKISKFSKKGSIKDFLSWCLTISQKINDYSEHSTFLSLFAEPINFEDIKDSLSPIAILLLSSKLHNDFNNGIIDSFDYVSGDKRRNIPIESFFKSIENFGEIQQINKDETEEMVKFKVINKGISDIELKVNMKSITLMSQKLKKIEINKSNGISLSLIDYLNRSNQFIINFESQDLIYTNRKLFRDSRLLGNVDYFLKVFKPYSELANSLSEKGSFAASNTKFDDSSLFGFVENSFLSENNFVICDDLGNEWADHITINHNKICFIHSKYKNSKFSASAFQDIIGQALKNIGNMTPQGYQLESKKSIWSEFYKNNSVETKIARIRKGNDINSLITEFKKTLDNPNFQREIKIVINFISKSELEDRLNKLKNNESFRERNQVIQILWFISSLISSCLESGINVYICCKP